MASFVLSTAHRRLISTYYTALIMGPQLPSRALVETVGYISDVSSRERENAVDDTQLFSFPAGSLATKNELIRVQILQRRAGRKSSLAAS